MPAILNEKSRPVRYIVIHRPMERRPPEVFDGPAVKGEPKAGDIQVMEEGIGIWTEDRVRTLYPWHTISEVTEVF